MSFLKYLWENQQFFSQYKYNTMFIVRTYIYFFIFFIVLYILSICLAFIFASCWGWFYCSSMKIVAVLGVYISSKALSAKILLWFYKSEKEKKKQSDCVTNASKYIIYLKCRVTDTGFNQWWYRQAKTLEGLFLDFFHYCASTCFKKSLRECGFVEAKSPTDATSFYAHLCKGEV